MTLLLSQKSTIGLRILAKYFNHPFQAPFLQRWKALRLRRRDPQWARVVLLVFVGDILLATVVWIAIDFVLR
jgi:hypothetical protein